MTNNKNFWAQKLWKIFFLKMFKNDLGLKNIAIPYYFLFSLGCKFVAESRIKYFEIFFIVPNHFWTFFKEKKFIIFELRNFCYLSFWSLKNLQIPQLSWLRKKFRWPKRLFHIFPTYGKSISINRTNSHVHTTRRSEQSAKKLKFDAATYTFKITMFKCKKKKKQWSVEMWIKTSTWKEQKN